MERLLLVDDAEAQRAIALLFLKGLPCEVDEAVDGAQALELFRVNAYVLVLLDLEMPGMNGLDAARAMRALEAAEQRHHTPILALTAHEDEGHARQCAQAGFDGVLVKPLRRPDLRELVSSRLPVF